MLHVKVVSSLDVNIEEATNRLADELLNLDVRLCGFDTEMTVITAMDSPLLGNEERVIPAIVQMCVKKEVGNAKYKFPIAGLKSGEVYTCYIFPLKALVKNGKHIPPRYMELLRSDRIVKASVGMKNDLNMLGRSIGFSIGSPLELQLLALITGESNLGLESLARRYTNLEKAESAGGNYDGELQEAQIKYAAMDAMLCHIIVENILGDKLVTYLPDEEIPLKANEIKNIWDFILSSATKEVSALTLTKLTNKLFNSYSDWKTKYSRIAVSKAASKFLDEAVKRGYLVHMKDNTYEQSDIKTIAPLSTVSPLAKIVLENQNNIEEVANTIYKLLSAHKDPAGYAPNTIITRMLSRIQLSGTREKKENLIQNAIDELVKKSLLKFSTRDKRYYIN